MIRVAVVMAGAVTVAALTLTAPDHGPVVFGDVTPLGAPVLIAPTPTTTTTNPSTTSSRAEPAPTPPTTPSTTPAPPSSTAAPKPAPKPTTTTTAPKPSTAPVRPVAGRYRCPAAVNAIAAAGAPAASLTTWDAIAWRESRCQQWAHRHVGGDDSYCWFQIEYGHGLAASRTARYGSAQSLLYSSTACAQAAMDLYRAAGWSPWS